MAPSKHSLSDIAPSVYDVYVFPHIGSGTLDAYAACVNGRGDYEAYETTRNQVVCAYNHPANVLMRADPGRDVIHHLSKKFWKWTGMRVDENVLALRLEEMRIVHQLSITYAGMRNIDWIRECHNLYALTIAFSNVSCIDGLRGLQLGWLELQRTPVWSINALSGMQYLYNLNLSSTLVECLDPLRNVTSLCALWLVDTPVHSVVALSGLLNLEQLALVGTRVRSVDALETCSSLKHLDLRGMRGCSTKALSGLVKNGLSILR